MTLLLVATPPVEAAFRTLLHAAAPGLEVVLFSETPASRNVSVAAAWNQRHGIWGGFPELRHVTSFGIGADHLLADPTLPAHVGLSRLVDPLLSEAMADFVLLALLAHRRSYPRYFIARQNRCWLAPSPAPVDTPRAAVLGLGSMGAAVGLALHRRRFAVSGWSRTEDTGLPFRCYAGETGLLDAVRGADYLICALPLTSATRGILSRTLFDELARGAYLVNVGRGDHLIEADLIHSLGSGQLSGAALDVFHEEPLPDSHPFWGIPAIDITPHVAAKPSRERIVRHFISTYMAVRDGELPDGMIGRSPSPAIGAEPLRVTSLSDPSDSCNPGAARPRSPVLSRIAQQFKGR